jgi:hypothetical protein
MMRSIGMLAARFASIECSRSFCGIFRTAWRERKARLGSPTSTARGIEPSRWRTRARGSGTERAFSGGIRPGVVVSTLTKFAASIMGRRKAVHTDSPSSFLITLPAPQTTGGMPLFDALRVRHSERSFAPEPLSLEGIVELALGRRRREPRRYRASYCASGARCTRSEHLCRAAEWRVFIRAGRARVAPREPVRHSPRHGTLEDRDGCCFGVNASRFISSRSSSGGPRSVKSA